MTIAVITSDQEFWNKCKAHFVQEHHPLCSDNVRSAESFDGSRILWIKNIPEDTCSYAFDVIYANPPIPLPL